MDKKRQIGLFLAASLVAVGGLIYELIIGTVSSYLLGNSILHFSLTIGLFLFGMGIGSFLSGYLRQDSTQLFVTIEILLGLVGGNSVVLLFGLFTFAQAWFYLGFGILVLSIGALIGLEIPLLLRMLQGFKHTHAVVTRVLSLDYLGSLIASILFPILLLPYLGILRTALVTGFINITLAGLVHFFLSKEIFKLSSIKSVLLIVCWIILAGEIVGANYVAAYFDHKLYQDEVIYSQQSAYQKIVMTKFKDDLRLFLDGNLQFSSVDEYRYHESLVHIPVSYLPLNQPQQVLILGGGDGLAAREVLKYDTVQKIVLVDLDPAITSLSQTHQNISDLNQHSLQHEKVELLNQDAMSFLDSTTDSFDAIIIDLPDPNNESLAKLYSKEFYQLVFKHLNESGVVITQATSPYFTNKSYWMIHDTMEEAGFVVKPFHLNVPSFGEWGFVMASKNNIFAQEPRDLTISTRFLNNDSLKNTFIFDKDMERKTMNKEISTLFNPLILHAYQEETKRWQ